MALECRIRGCSLDTIFIAREALDESFQQWLKSGEVDQGRVSYFGPRSKLISLSGDRISHLYSLEQNSSKSFEYVRCGVPMSMLLSLWPHSMFIGYLRAERVTISASGDIAPPDALDHLIAICTSFRCFWGQAHPLQYGKADDIDFMESIPKLALVNYFSDHFAESFGGLSVLRQAGFVLIKEVPGGVITTLGSLEDLPSVSEFTERRRNAQAVLGASYFDNDGKAVIERLRQLLPYPYDPPLVTGPRADRISLKKRLVEFAKKNALESVYRSGNLFPSVFIGVVGGDANFFSLQLASLDSVREAAREHLAKKYANADAYAFAYDSEINCEGSECDAVIIESAARDDPLAVELAVVYDRPNRLVRQEFVCGETDNLLED